jgi:hypothetical protein
LPPAACYQNFTLLSETYKHGNPSQSLAFHLWLVTQEEAMRTREQIQSDIDVLKESKKLADQDLESLPHDSAKARELRLMMIENDAELSSLLAELNVAK